MLQLTFNPGLTLTGFRTTRPRHLTAVKRKSMRNALVPVAGRAFSSPEATILLACGRNREALGATISGMRHR